ncbi:MAG TPA: hypothetical protein GXX56_00025 [Rhodocyclaceae bacterium]|nr:hypothetical protein [Rhodocyclaceae bacterium]
MNIKTLLLKNCPGFTGIGFWLAESIEHAVVSAVERRSSGSRRNGFMRLISKNGRCKHVRRRVFCASVCRLGNTGAASPTATKNPFVRRSKQN